MPYIYVVLKDGQRIPVVEADVAEWVREPEYVGAGGDKDILRLVCRRGDRVLGRFNGADVAGYAWHDGTPTNLSTR